jgi:hypothetical protein
LLSVVDVDQRVAPGGDGWSLLGIHRIDSGTLTLQLSNSADGSVIADAIRVVSMPGVALSETTSQSTTSSPVFDLDVMADATLRPASNSSGVLTSVQMDDDNVQMPFRIDTLENVVKLDDTTFFLRGADTDNNKSDITSAVDAALEELDQESINDELVDELATLLL